MSRVLLGKKIYGPSRASVQTANTRLPGWVREQGSLMGPSAARGGDGFNKRWLRQDQSCSFSDHLWRLSTGLDSYTTERLGDIVEALLSPSQVTNINWETTGMFTWSFKTLGVVFPLVAFHAGTKRMRPSVQAVKTRGLPRRLCRRVVPRCA